MNEPHVTGTKHFVRCRLLCIGVCRLFLETSLHSVFIVGYNVRDTAASEIVAKIVFLSPRKVDSTGKMYVCLDISCPSQC